MGLRILPHKNSDLRNPKDYLITLTLTVISPLSDHKQLDVKGILKK